MGFKTSRMSGVRELRIADKHYELMGRWISIIKSIVANVRSLDEITTSLFCVIKCRITFS